MAIYTNSRGVEIEVHDEKARGIGDLVGQISIPGANPDDIML